jgi:invasin C
MPIAIPPSTAHRLANIATSTVHRLANTAFMQPESGKVRGEQNNIPVSFLAGMLKLHESKGGLITEKPQLALPIDVRKMQDVGVLRSWLADKQDDGRLTAGLEGFTGTLVQRVTEQLEKNPENGAVVFDISGMSSRMATLISQAIVLVSALRTAESALSSKMSLVKNENDKNVAASIQREGREMLGSSIAQGVSQMAVTGVGTKQQLNGLSAERGVLKNNMPKFNKLNDEARQIQNTLAHQNPVKLGLDADSLKEVRLKPQSTAQQQTATSLSGQTKVSVAPEGDSIALQSSHSRLSKEHESTLMGLNEDIKVKTQAESVAMENTRLKAQAKQAQGRAITDGSRAVSDIAGSGGRYAAALEQSEQQIKRSASQVAGTASDEANKRKDAASSLIQDLLRTLESTSQSQQAAMGAVAGNIRA